VRKNDHVGARRLVSQVYTLLLTVLLVLTILGTLYAETVVGWIAGSSESFAGIPGKFELTAHQTQIMFCFVLLVSLYAYFMAVLNALKIFWLPAFAPTLWNVSMIGFIVFGRGYLGNDALAWGTVIGGVLQLAILIPTMVKQGFWPRFVFKVWSPEVKKILKTMDGDHQWSSPVLRPENSASGSLLMLPWSTRSTSEKEQFGSHRSPSVEESPSSQTVQASEHRRCPCRTRSPGLSCCLLCSKQIPRV
jgi:hypothetical protein